jgi:hypothetical protein
MGRGVWPQNFFRMWIERNDERRSICRARVGSRCRDDSLMAAVNAIEYADGEEDGTGQVRQLGNEVERFHYQND